MKKRKIIMCGIAIIVLCVTFFSDGTKQDASALTMSSITSDSIKDKENQIRQAQDEKETLQSGLSNLQNIKAELETQRSSLKNYVAQLDGNLAQIEQNIQELSAKITAKEEEIAVAQEELESALKNEETQKESMIDRIRMVYESGDPQMMDMLLKSSSFSDFLNKADYVEKVIAYDQKMWQDYKLVREYVELCKQELELEKEILDEARWGGRAEKPGGPDRPEEPGYCGI